MQAFAFILVLASYTLAQNDKPTGAPIVPTPYNAALFPGLFPAQQRYFPGSPYYNPAVASAYSPAVAGAYNPAVTAAYNPAVAGAYNPAVAGAYNPAIAGAYNPYFAGAAYRFNQTGARIPAVVPTPGVTIRPGVVIPGAGAAIISKVEEVNPDGSFNYAYETENGIVAQASGLLKNLGVEGQEGQAMQGSFSYTSPEGLPITVTWYADETGFHAEGQHLPRQPIVPTGDITISPQPSRSN